MYSRMSGLKTTGAAAQRVPPSSRAILGRFCDQFLPHQMRLRIVQGFFDEARLKIDAYANLHQRIKPSSKCPAVSWDFLGCGVSVSYLQPQGENVELYRLAGPITRADTQPKQ